MFDLKISDLISNTFMMSWFWIRFPWDYDNPPSQQRWGRYKYGEQTDAWQRGCGEGRWANWVKGSGRGRLPATERISRMNESPSTGRTVSDVVIVTNGDGYGEHSAQDRGFESPETNVVSCVNYTKKKLKRSVPIPFFMCGGLCGCFPKNWYHIKVWNYEKEFEIKYLSPNPSYLIDTSDVPFRIEVMTRI